MGKMQAHLTETENISQPTWRDYLELTKPGMVGILLLSAVAAMFTAARGFPSLETFALAVVALYLALSGASVLNSYLDWDLDELVKCTRNRPLSTHKIELNQALAMGLLMVGLSALIFFTTVNWVAGLLMLVGVFLHVIVYTRWLKRRSVYSTVVAGIAGSFPILVGWASITGSVAVEALLFFAVVFYWATPHFWSLALLHRNEYVRAAIPMLPVLQGSNAARLQIGRYTVLMVVLSLIPVGLGLLDRYYAFAALALGSLMIYNAAQLYQAPSIQTNLRFYKHSFLYITLLMGAMLADREIF
jgi:heme o synthase